MLRIRERRSREPITGRIARADRLRILTCSADTLCDVAAVAATGPVRSRMGFEEENNIMNAQCEEVMDFVDALTDVLALGEGHCTSIMK